MKLIFLDTETTSADENARLVELAYKTTEAGFKNEPVCALFKPPQPIPFGAMSVHGITNEMVEEKESFESSPEKTKLQNLLKKDILVAHNAPFDIQVLKNEGVETVNFIDTLRVAKHLLPNEESHKLQFLRYSLGIYKKLGDSNIAHSAAGDIEVLEHLFNHLKSILDTGEDENGQMFFTPYEKIILEMIRLSTAPVKLSVFQFGKYSGKTFEEVARIDRNYLNWLLNSESQKSELEQNSDLIFTIKEALK